MKTAERVEVEVEGRKLSLSNLAKVYYPAAGFTKGEVIDYYARVAPAMVPHARGRTLNLKRYPDGVQGEFFFQKECPVPHPSWVHTKSVHGEGDDGIVHYCVIEDTAGLVWLANLGSIEIHTYLALARARTRPTQLVFDLDPGEPAALLEAADMALRLKALLEELGLQSFAKTSGGKGVHLVVPLNTPVTYVQTKTFAHAVASLMERQHPDEATANMRKSLRAGKVFVDWSQNDTHKSTVCVYSLRARERPTVSTPVETRELKRAVKQGDAGLLTFEAKDVLRRVSRKGDLFEPTLTLKQNLPSL